MYAIIGVTGHVGGATARALLRQGKKVRALVRDEKKGEPWKAQGAEIAIASIEDASQLERAFAEIEGAFVMTPPFFQSLDPRGENLVALAAFSHSLRAAHVPKIVFLSSVGAQHDQGTGAILKGHDMERALFELGIPATSIRAASFMENYAPLLEAARATGKLPSMIEPLDRSVPMVATADIGETAARWLIDTSWYGNHIVELEGPRTYSANDVASTLTKIFKTPIAAEVVPAGARAAAYESFGASPATAASLAEMWEGFNSGHVTFEGGSATHEKGPTTLEEVFSKLT